MDLRLRPRPVRMAVRAEQAPRGLDAPAHELLQYPLHPHHARRPPGIAVPAHRPEASQVTPVSFPGTASCYGMVGSALPAPDSVVNPISPAVERCDDSAITCGRYAMTRWRFCTGAGLTGRSGRSARFSLAE